MSYQQYYEQDPSQQQEEQQPQKSSRKGLWITLIGVTAVLAILILLVVGFVRSLGTKLELEGILPEDSVLENILQETPDPTPKPQPTPLPTERPMADLDGEAPFILELANPIPEIAEAVGASVVGVENYILTKQGKPVLQGEGSGFIVSTDGYILTNTHVVEGAELLKVYMAGGEELEAEFIGKDAQTDIAVLKVNRSGLKALKLGNSDTIRVGEYVVAVGNPLGRQLEGTVTMGIISARAREINIDGYSNIYIQTDAAINFGNSGGPLLNMQGEVIGINTAKSVSAGYDAYGQLISAEGLGFALPINDVVRTMEQLITKGYIQRPGIGVMIISLTEEEAKEEGIAGGVWLHSVTEGGPAAAAGLQSGDIVVACDGETVLQQERMVELVSQKQVGDEMVFTILRDGVTMDITVVIGDKNNIG